MYLYEYKGEAQRIYITSWRILRVFLFFFLGTILTASAVFVAYLMAVGKLIFKSTILVTGLDLDIFLFTKTLSAVGQAVAGLFSAEWLYTSFFAPFGAFLHVITNFGFSLETLSVTCSGSSAPPKLLSDLFILGVVICVIQSDFAIYKAVTHDSLAKKFLAIASSESYNIWSPAHYRVSAQEDELLHHTYWVPHWNSKAP